METIDLYVGYDPQEALGFNVFCNSVVRRSTVPVRITPLALKGLEARWVRDRDKLQSTDFAFTRFLTPYLARYTGWSIFCDGDMLCLADISELRAYMDRKYAVLVVKRPNAVGPEAETSKFMGRANPGYPRKNWSSVMVFNNALCRALTPEYVRTAPGLDLHQFKWVPDELIGDLPREWNHLVMVDSPNPGAKIVHYTLGLPSVHAHRDFEYAGDWVNELHHLQRHEFQFKLSSQNAEDL